MLTKLEYIKDIAGANYIGINIYSDAVFPFLEKMKTFVGDEYDEYVKNQQDRDRNHYHCTIMNVSDLNKVITKDINNANILNQIITDFEADDFQMLGLGSAQKNENKTYFVVCRSTLLQEFRRRFNLEQIDFHITIGFKWRDVFGLRKNVVLADKEPFIDEISKYYKDFDESFNFIKELDGYDYDLSKDIYCTKIVPTYAEFRIGNEHGVSDYITVSKITNKLTIVCKWQNSEEIPYLSNTVILRKLNYDKT